MSDPVGRELPLYVCHKQVRALKIKAIQRGLGCASNEANIICGEAEIFHTPEAARADVGFDHVFSVGIFDATSALIVPEDSRYAPFPNEL